MLYRQKFTKETQRQILDDLLEGNYRKVAASNSGITYETLLTWIKRGEEEEKEGEEGEFRDFYIAVKGAEAKFESRTLERIMSRDNEKIMLEVLARKYPDRWSSTSRVAVQVEAQIEEYLNHLFVHLADHPEALALVTEITSKYQKS